MNAKVNTISIRSLTQPAATQSATFVAFGVNYLGHKWVTGPTGGQFIGVSFFFMLFNP